MPIKIVGSTSNNVAEVDSNNNLKSNLPTTDTQAGYAALAVQSDLGTVIGTREMRKLRASQETRLAVGQDTLIYSTDLWGQTGGTDSRNQWANVNSTMTKGIVSGVMQLNQGLSVLSGAYSALGTYRGFPILDQFATKARMQISFSQLPQANNLCEWGLFGFSKSSPNAAMIDGVFFRYDAAGAFTARSCHNTVEQSVTISSPSTLVGTSTMRTFEISATNNVAKFYIDDVLVATITRSVGLSGLTMSQNHCLSFRNINSGTVGTAQRMDIGNCSVILADMTPTKPWSHIMAGMGRVAAQLPQTGSSNAMSAGNMTNNSAPAAAAMTNTTAALGTGLGGQFVANPTLTAATDGILCSYLNLDYAATSANRTLYITGVKISAVVTTVLANTAAVIYSHALVFGSNALSLATADSGSATKGGRRIPLGFQSFAVNAAVGVLGQDVSMKFDTPIPVHPSEYVQIASKNIGTVTTSGAITFLVTFDGYWE